MGGNFVLPVFTDTPDSVHVNREYSDFHVNALNGKVYLRSSSYFLKAGTGTERQGLESRRVQLCPIGGLQPTASVPRRDM